MHVYKIADNEENLNKSASFFTTTLTLSSARDIKDKLSECKDDSSCKLIYKYKNIFQNKLSDSLSLKCENKHEIKMRNAKLVNINTYSSSKTHLNK